VQARLGGHRGATAPVAEVRGQHRWDVDHLYPFSLGAWGGVHPAVEEDEVPPDRPLDEAAEKLVDLALDGPAQDDLQSAPPV
jgi:hypothetical protein